VIVTGVVTALLVYWIALAVLSPPAGRMM